MSSKVQLDVLYLKLGVVPSGERLLRQAWCNLQVKLCDPCLSTLRLCLHSKWRYINTLPVLSFNMPLMQMSDIVKPYSSLP